MVVEKREPVTDSVIVFDVLIAGAGASGLALAAAVKQALGAGVSIAVVDPAPAPSHEAGAAPLRKGAIAEGPRRPLGPLGALAPLGPESPSVLAMAILGRRGPH